MVWASQGKFTAKIYFVKATRDFSNVGIRYLHLAMNIFVIFKLGFGFYFPPRTLYICFMAVKYSYFIKYFRKYVRSASTPGVTKKKEGKETLATSYKKHGMFNRVHVSDKCFCFDFIKFYQLKLLKTNLFEKRFVLSNLIVLLLYLNNFPIVDVFT